VVREDPGGLTGPDLDAAERAFAAGDWGRAGRIARAVEPPTAASREIAARFRPDPLAFALVALSLALLVFTWLRYVGR
jgi:hypothetical protein